MTNEYLYSAKETAQVFGTNVAFVYELIKKGILPSIKLGSYKIRKIDIEAFLEKYNGYDLTNLDNITPLKVGDLSA